jgi:UDP-glucose 4-epimerase
MFPSIERVYVNAKAREDLGWTPKYDFGYVLEELRHNRDPRSALAGVLGIKGYHGGKYEGGCYPTECSQ